MSLLSLVCCLLLGVVAIQAAKVTLPDYSGPPLNIESGYVTVDQAHGRRIFYVYIESINTKVPSSDLPLAVWFQGGPGCSGLSGLMSENGPFRVTANGKQINFNNITWLHHANMLWIEQPAGVGFSYSDDILDYRTDDTKAAKDSLATIKGFVKTHPQFNASKIWLTGESYGGVYIPTTAVDVIADPEIGHQLAGLMLGNPVIGCDSDKVLTGLIPIRMGLLYWHGLVSYHLYEPWVTKDCERYPVEKVDCLILAASMALGVGKIDQQISKATTESEWVLPSEVFVTPQWKQLQRQMLSHNLTDFQKHILRDHLLMTEEQFVATFEPMSPEAETRYPSLDPDDLYTDFCTGNGTLRFAESLPGECDVYGSNYVAYLNRADVQQALGAKATTWTVCSDRIDYSSNAGSMIPYYEKIFSQRPDIRVMVYSGDLDMLTVPFAVTQTCLNDMPASKNRKSDWGPWFNRGHTAGYFEEFDQYTYATIKGAGHEAPQFQPINSAELFRRFLNNLPLKE